MTTISVDKALYMGLKEGNADSFKEIYKEHFVPLYYYAKKFVKHEESAKDVVQNVFLNLWMKRSSITIMTSVSSYLYKAVFNQALNQIKKESTKRKAKEKYKEQVAYSKSYFSVSQKNGLSKMISDDYFRILNQSIDKLPDKCKNIFKLSRFKGLKNKEIAEELNITLNTVQTQMSIAIRRIRESVSNELKINL